jgi:hypothetical protein
MMHKKFFLCIFFWICFNFASMYALHICGNYCGPNWCNGMDLVEKNCDTSVMSMVVVENTMRAVEREIL